MSRLPEFITFTGADDWTDLAGMAALAQDYPVEFGILMSPGRTGSARYPSEFWIGRLCQVAYDRPRMRLSAHLCGRYSDELAQLGATACALLGRDHHFTRCQANIRERLVPAPLPLAAIGKWAAELGMRAIVQSRDPARFPTRREVEWLYDCSGGRGQAPAQGWPIELREPTGTPRLVGFAGGLGPKNVAAAVEVFGTRAQRYWIDMETGVRNCADHFDLDMCRAVCEAVYGRPGEHTA